VRALARRTGSSRLRRGDQPEANHRAGRSRQFAGVDRGSRGLRKELAARLIHAHSVRAEGPFVVVNAPAITPRAWRANCSASTPGRIAPAASARSRRPRRHALPRRSGRHASETQAKILRVLVDQNFKRVGGSAPVHVDVRIVSSTSRDLAQAITDGLFREDLFHRLSVVPIRVPSLAERREDIPELVQFFVEQVATSMGIAPRRIAADASAVLQSHDWPGNIRQLRNNIERLMILVAGDPRRKSRRRCCRPKSARWSLRFRAASAARN